MIEVHVCDTITPDDVSSVRELCDTAEAADGHPELNDDAERALTESGARTRLLLARAGETLVGALVLFARDEATAGTFTSMVVVHPDHRGLDIDTALIRVAGEDARRLGGSRLQLLVIGADDATDARAAASRFDPEREFHQMRVGLPLGESVVWPEGTSVRSFVPGQDEDEWLAVNSRAFSWDPDQGRWSHDTLRHWMAQPWFDPSGFLVAVDDAGMAGFCWTKLHPADPPREAAALGEIYIIGVDPDRQGAGLGRALVVAGLASTRLRGARTGMLFVDGANAPAIRLYEKLGFTTTRVDRVYGTSLR